MPEWSVSAKRSTNCAPELNAFPAVRLCQIDNRLQRDGYYAGPIDGQLGPMTRQAIAAFQADHGLAITSTVDEPTLSRLGLS